MFILVGWNSFSSEKSMGLFATILPVSTQTFHLNIQGNTLFHLWSKPNSRSICIHSDYLCLTFDNTCLHFFDQGSYNAQLCQTASDMCHNVWLRNSFRFHKKATLRANWSAVESDWACSDAGLNHHPWQTLVLLLTKEHLISLFPTVRRITLEELYLQVCSNPKPENCKS